MSNKSKNNIQGLDPDRWVEKYSDYLYRFARFRLHDPTAAEDMVQDTFLAALHSKGNFKGTSSEKTWITGIIKHKILDYYRKTTMERRSDNKPFVQKDTKKLLKQDRNGDVQSADWVRNAQQLYEDREFMAILYTCLSEMSGKASTAFLMREIEGKKADEICNILEISKSNYWVILYRARNLLKSCLGDKWSGNEINGV